MACLHADCHRIAVENPVPSSVFELPPPTQVIQPHEYGEPYTKKTYLWLKGLPPLQPTERLDRAKPFLPSGTVRKLRGDTYGIARTAKDRSKTFPKIAEAMAAQWTADDIAECEIEQQVLGGFYT